MNIWAWRGFLDPATSSWLLVSWDTICLPISKRPDSSTEHLCSSQRQLKACSAVKSRSFDLALVLVPHNEVAGLGSMEKAQFM